MTSPDFSLLETMRWEGGIALLDRHLARLAAAAEAFGFAYDEIATRASLDHATDALDAAPYRVRLLVSPDGSAAVETSALDASAPLRSALVTAAAETPGGPFWKHKTTHRPHYEAPYHVALAVGFDEAILLDAAGFVIEGTRTTVWVERDGALVTPPLAAGCLPGVYRAHLLDTRAGAAEVPVSRADLLGAGAVYLSNAVRGLFPVVVAAAPL